LTASIGLQAGTHFFIARKSIGGAFLSIDFESAGKLCIVERQN
jgi:hypothetical protein